MKYDMFSKNLKKISFLFINSLVFVNSAVHAKNCQESINELRQIQIVILKKTPAMPPLVKLVAPINQALRKAEDYRDVGDFNNCINVTSKTTQIMQIYAN